MLKIRFRQRLLISRQWMVAGSASAEEDDGNKCREDSPSKITTFSVGQGEAPPNLLTVIHNPRKRFFTRIIASASREWHLLGKRSI
jgi:hypothetical protein